VPRRLLETVEAAGLQTTTWTIAFAGRYATGSNLVFVLILAQDVRRIRGPAEGRMPMTDGTGPATMSG
jgi:hypothetical protein